MTDLDKNLNNKLNDGELNEVSGGIDVEVATIKDTNAIYGLTQDLKKGGAVNNKLQSSKLPPKAVFAKEVEKDSNLKDLSISKAAARWKDPE